MQYGRDKGKGIPLKTRTGLQGSRRLRFPEFLDNQNTKVVRLSAEGTGRIYPEVYIPGTHFCYSLSWPQISQQSHRKENPQPFGLNVVSEPTSPPGHVVNGTSWAVETIFALPYLADTPAEYTLAQGHAVKFSPRRACKAPTLKYEALSMGRTECNNRWTPIYIVNWTAKYSNSFMQKTFTEMEVSQQMYELFQSYLYKWLTLMQHVSFRCPLTSKP